MDKVQIIKERLEALRTWMRRHGVMAYIFPSTDPHAGEYVPDHWKAREWISGFNGSAGTAVVTLTRAALWTDSRYWLAAEEQTAGTSFCVVHCSRNVATARELASWILQEECGMEIKVGLDPWTNTAQSVQALQEAFGEYQGVHTTFYTERIPTDELWTDRPPIPTAPVEVQPLALAGATLEEKLDAIRHALSLTGADALLVTQLDEIAWALNLRGTDVHCTPVFVSYLVILGNTPPSPLSSRSGKKPQAILYVNEAKLTTAVRAYIEEHAIQVRPYEAIREDLLSLDTDGTNLQLCNLQMDPEVTPYALFQTIGEGECSSFSTAPSTIPALRAIKNEAEQAGYRSAMLKDGVAMVKFLRWLEEEMQRGSAITEITVDQRLTALRAEQEGFRDLSFDTIAGYGPHAAIVHYEATPETDVPLEPHGLLLLDSGAQYQDGTTDITRTIALGPLTEAERRDYTLVLKGHIRLATAVFPDGTSGTQLDALARYAMWQDHKNYGHGTGHGVGSYLSVHEGPHQFRMNWMPAPLHAGMTVTIEPGIYIAGSHGCRTENTMLIVSDGENDFGQWLRLEPLTLCPIDTRPIVWELMTADEIAYLHQYHDRVREALLPLMDDEQDRQWLLRATEGINN